MTARNPKEVIEESTGIKPSAESGLTVEGYELADLCPELPVVCQKEEKHECASYKGLAQGDKCQVPGCGRKKPGI